MFTQVLLLLTRLLLGELDRMGFLLVKMGRSRTGFPGPLPYPYSYPHRNSGENRPCREPGRQALGKGFPCASLLSLLPARQDTDGKGFPGTQPNCLCRFAREEIQTPHKTVRRKAVNEFKHSKLC